MCIRAISMLDDVFVLDKAVYTDVHKTASSEDMQNNIGKPTFSRNYL